MKKTIYTLALALLIYSAFVLTALADTNTVDTPIAIKFGEEVTGTLPDGTFEHTFFYTFTATVEGEYQFKESDSSIKLTFYNYMDHGGTWGRGSVISGSRQYEAGEEVRFAVAKNNVDNPASFAFTVFAPGTAPVAPVEPDSPGDKTKGSPLTTVIIVIVVIVIILGAGGAAKSRGGGGYSGGSSGSSGGGRSRSSGSSSSSSNQSGFKCPTCGKRNMSHNCSCGGSRYG